MPDQLTLFDVLPPPPPPRPVPAGELERRDTNRAALLDALRRGPRYGHELALIAGHRFAARLKELRDDGHEIDTERVGNGVYRYTLTREARP